MKYVVTIIPKTMRYTWTAGTRCDARHSCQQYHFRCLLRSFVHIMSQNRIVAEAYKKTQENRTNAIASNIKNLADNKYLKTKGKEQRDFLVSALSLISRFWISEAAISLKHRDKNSQILHYLGLVTHLLLPYTTAKGKKEIKAYL